MGPRSPIKAPSADALRVPVAIDKLSPRRRRAGTGHVPARAPLLLPALVLGLVVAIPAAGALAGGFGLREQSAYYQGTSFAGAAAGGEGLAAMYWNPAAISFAPGLAMEANVSYVMPSAGIDVLAARDAFGTDLGRLGVGDIADDGAIPASYFSYAMGDLAIGVALTAPYGLVTDAPCNWSGRYYGCYSRIFDMNAQVSVAYRLTDWLTLGAGISANYMDARLSNAQIFGGVPPNLVGGTAQVDGDGLGMGFSLGALFTLGPGTTFGIGYRSAVSQTLNGEVTARGPGLVLPPLPARAEITLPDQVTASFRSQITPQWTVLATGEWTNWSELKQLDVVSGGRTVSALELDWTDGWFASVGAEYQVDPRLALRAGLGYELSPVPDSTRSPRLPDTNRIWLSAGLTYAVSAALSLDLAYTHILGETSPITQLPVSPANAPRGTLLAEVADPHVHIVSAGLRYRFATEPMPPVTK